MTVQDMLDSLNRVKDKSKKIYVTDIITGTKYIDIDDIVEDDETVRYIIET